jgi:hypothetical protein
LHFGHFHGNGSRFEKKSTLKIKTSHGIWYSYKVS